MLELFPHFLTVGRHRPHVVGESLRLWEVVVVFGSISLICVTGGQSDEALVPQLTSYWPMLLIHRRRSDSLISATFVMRNLRCITCVFDSLLVSIFFFFFFLLLHHFSFTPLPPIRTLRSQRQQQ